MELTSCKTLITMCSNYKMLIPKSNFICKMTNSDCDFEDRTGKSRF